MRIFIFVFVWLWMACPALGQTDEATRHAIEEMGWMTEQYPPFNYVDDEDGKLNGITVDVLMAMFKKVGVTLDPTDIEVLPWARGYKRVLEKPGSVLFSTTYTVERLQNFRFVGPIIPTWVSVIAPKRSNLTVKDVEDMNRLRIGVVRDDIGDQLIQAMRVNDSLIERSSSALNMMQMLSRGRIDAIAYAEDVAHYQFGAAGLNPDDFETIYVLKRSDMGYSFHRSTDPRILEPLRKALDELRADGTIEQIYSSYIRETK